MARHQSADINHHQSAVGVYQEARSTDKLLATSQSVLRVPLDVHFKNYFIFNGTMFLSLCS